MTGAETWSRLGLGTWQFSSHGWRTRLSPADASRLVERAAEAGIGWYDTAPSYGDGRAEAILGRCAPADAWICTKVAPDEPNTSKVRSAVRRSLAGSIRRLGCDRRLLLYLHHPAATVEHTMAYWRAIVEVVEEGWVNAAGLSNCRTETVSAALQEGPVSVVQNELSILGWSDRLATECDAIRGCGVRVVGYGLLAHGLLGGRGSDGERRRYPRHDWRAGIVPSGYYEKYFSPSGRSAHAPLLDAIRARARHAGRSVAQYATAWAMQNASVDHWVVGVSSTRQLDELTSVTCEAGRPR
ncbi:MAG: aldo/keto reductase [Acidimicrobiales bacterium]